MKELRRMAEGAGRSPQEININYVIYGAPNLEQAVEDLRNAGVDRVALAVTPSEKDTVLPILDRYINLTRE
jgi:hypothetical protein